jgi:hypothetical protein
MKLFLLSLAFVVVGLFLIGMGFWTKKERLNPGNLIELEKKKNGFVLSGTILVVLGTCILIFSVIHNFSVIHKYRNKSQIVHLAKPPAELQNVSEADDQFFDQFSD